MLNLTQSQLADGLGLTFQQVQKYEKGTNRISASRLHQMSHILRVPVPFFFEGMPGELHLPERPECGPTIASDVSALLSTSDGIALVRAYIRIKHPHVQRAIIALIEQIVAEPAERIGAVPDAPALQPSSRKATDTLSALGIGTQTKGDNIGSLVIASGNY
jgi:transcriptional regulator with XRE-family HTH domain